MIILPRSFTQQPKGAIRPAPSIALRGGKALAVSWASTPYNNMGHTPTIGSSITFAPVKSGTMAWSFPTSGTSSVNFGTRPVTNFGESTDGWLWMLYVFNPGNSANWHATANYIAARSDNNVANGWVLYHNNAGKITLKLVAASLNPQASTPSSALSSDTPVVLLVARDGTSTVFSSSTIKMWVDGVAQSMTIDVGGAGALGSDAAQSLQLGYGVFSANANLAGSMSLAAFGRGDPSNYAYQLCKNPWQIFAPARKTLFGVAAAGGGIPYWAFGRRPSRVIGAGMH